LPTPPRPQPVALRIELLHVVPLVWRRVLVSNQWTLASLHRDQHDTADTKTYYIMFVSGYYADVYRGNGLRDEGLELLSKLVAAAELLRRVRAVLDR